MPKGKEHGRYVTTSVIPKHTRDDSQRVGTEPEQGDRQMANREQRSNREQRMGAVLRIFF
jgi:hypothetical protein